MTPFTYFIDKWDITPCYTKLGEWGVSHGGLSSLTLHLEHPEHPATKGYSLGRPSLPGFQWQMKVYRDPLLKM